ncbi:MAG: hypothetical protein WCB27_16275 [Thermoguttaceae bacterium]
MKRLLRLAVVFGVVFCSLPALAKTPKPQAKTPIATDDSDQEPPLVLKVYDVSDVQLAVAGPSRGIDDMDGTGSAYGESIFPQPGSLPGPAPYNPRALTNGSNMELPDARDPIEQLRDAINALILGPDSVDNNGRSDIHVLGEVLAVSATEKNHRQIAAFLDALRQHAATRKVVAVEVHWLWLTEEQLKSLVPSNAGGDRATVCLNVDETTWHRLAKERAKEDSELRPGYHAAVTCMNGQTVLASGGSQKRFISTMIPVVGDAVPSVASPANPPSTSPQQSSPSTGYQPVITTIQEGAAVQLKPIVCGDHVLLDIRARAIEVQKSDNSAPAARQPSDSRMVADRQAGAVRELAVAVERPVVLNYRVDTTLRVPFGHRVLVGGITRSAEPDNGEPNLYVFVEVSIVAPPSTSPAHKR